MGIALSAEKDNNRLMEMILRSAKDLMRPVASEDEEREEARQHAPAGDESRDDP